MLIAYFIKYDILTDTVFPLNCYKLTCIICCTLNYPLACPPGIIENYLKTVVNICYSVIFHTKSSTFKPSWYLALVNCLYNRAVANENAIHRMVTLMDMCNQL